MMDKSLIYNKSVDTDEDSTWIQLLRGASDDRPDLPNNAVTRQGRGRTLFEREACFSETRSFNLLEAKS